MTCDLQDGKSVNLKVKFSTMNEFREILKEQSTHKKLKKLSPTGWKICKFEILRSLLKRVDHI